MRHPTRACEAPDMARGAGLPLPAGLARQAARPSINVRVHRGLAPVEEVWNWLERTGHATAFQSWRWVVLAARHLAKTAEILVAEVREGDRTLMLLPLVRHRRRGALILTGLDLEVCDYNAPLLAPTHDLGPDRIALVWRKLVAVLPAADLLSLRRMPPLITGEPNPLVGLRGVTPDSVRAFGVPVSPPASDLIRRVSRPSTFRDFAKFGRRLEKRGTVAFRIASTPDEVERFFSALVEQRAARFAEIGRANLLDAPKTQAFYEAAAQDGLSGGPVRLAALMVDDEIVGTAYGLVRGADFCLVIQTMAGGTWRNCSPGVLVTARMMEWAVTEGLTLFDFTIGHLVYKTDLGATEGDLYEYALPLTPLGSAILGGDRLIRNAKIALQRHPAVFGRLRTLRRALRRMT